MKKRTDIENIVNKVANEQGYIIKHAPKNTHDKVEFLDKNGCLITQDFYNFINKIDYFKLSKINTAKKERTPENEILSFFKIHQELELINFNYDNFKNQQTLLDIKCKKCNKIFKRNFSNLNKNQRCPLCSRQKNRVYGKTTEQFKKDVYSAFGNEYIVIGEYVDARTRIKIKHTVCNTEFEPPAGRFLREEGFKCPTCTTYKSRGEVSLNKCLSLNKINFIEQKKFSGLKLEKELVVDFFIPELNLVIEYDGEHHFRPIEYFSKFTNSEKVKQSDILKENYCNDNSIYLLRIPFWEYHNIEKIINKILIYKLQLIEKTINISQIISELENDNIFLDKKYYEKYKNKNIYKKP